MKRNKKKNMEEAKWKGGSKRNQLLVVLQENDRIVRSDDSIQKQALAALRVKWHGASCDTTQRKLVGNNCEAQVSCYYVGWGLLKAFCNETIIPEKGT